MGYLIRAIVAKAELAQAIHTSLPPVARFAGLAQGYALIPVTEDLYDAVTDGSGEKVMGFWFLPGGFDATLAEWSKQGPVSYVEAEYFGGRGVQSAAVWADGQVVLGPLHQPEGEAHAEQGSPISQALRHLGVQKGDGHDEFDTAGLNRYRDVDHWGSDDSN
jgi:hypothetical protein